MTAPTRKERRAARAAQRVREVTRGRGVVIGLVVVLIGAAIAGQVFLTGSRPSRVQVLPVSAVPTPADVDATWYCAEGTSNPNGRADEAVMLGNVGIGDAMVDVTVHSQGTAQTKSFVVAGGAQQRVRVADILAAPDPGVTVYARGGTVVVEHEVRGSNDVALGPCARRASTEWYFAAGSTVKGAFEWMSLYNPFTEGAIVDMDVLTREISGETTTDRPVERIQSINVPGRTRVTIGIHERVGRYSATGVNVRARFGRIVAERALVFTDVNGQNGLAVSLGATALARTWMFPEGKISEGRSEVVAVANPSDTPAQVTLASYFEGGITVEPTAVTVTPRTVVNIAVPPAPQNSPRTSVLTSSIPVVAEMRIATVKPVKATGIATVMGETFPYHVTTFTAVKLSATSVDRYRVFNPGPRTAKVIWAVPGSDGSVPGSDGSVQSAILAPGASATFEAKIKATNALLSVLSDEPVVVVRVSEGGGITVSPGMPIP